MFQYLGLRLPALIARVNSALNLVRSDVPISGFRDLPLADVVLLLSSSPSGGLEGFPDHPI
jgi:hypothetical protein